MSLSLHIDAASARPKYQQIADALLSGIQTRMIGVAEQLPSINEISAQYDVSRDTVERAYKLLKRDGFIRSVRGKGYFARDGEQCAPRVLVVLDRLTDEHRAVFEGVVEALGREAEVELQLYHGSFRAFESILRRGRGRFTEFVLGPSFVGANVLRAGELAGDLLADRRIVYVHAHPPGGHASAGAVTQDLHADLLACLAEAREALGKYDRLSLLFDPESPARGLITGLLEFAGREGFDADVDTTDCAPPRLAAGTAYVVVTDRQLAEVVAAAKAQGLRLGRDVGVVAVGDSPLKEALGGGIAVVDTDYRRMGALAAGMFDGRTLGRARCSARLIARASL